MKRFLVGFGLVAAFAGSSGCATVLQHLPQGHTVKTCWTPPDVLGRRFKVTTDEWAGLQDCQP